MASKGAAYMASASDFKRAMAALPSGVAIITAASREGGWCGATVSAFMSLSVAPPLVGMALDSSSQTSMAVEMSKGFAVHIVGAEHQALAVRFAAKAHNKFAGLTTQVNARGVPVIRGFEIVLECALQATYPAGDHLMFIGLVEAITAGVSSQPTVWFERRFHPLPTYTAAP